MTKQERPASASHGRQLLAKNLVELRGLRGWTQDEMALQTGINRGTIHLLEAKHRNVTLETLERFAAALSVPLARLFQDEQSTPPEHPKE